MIRNHIVIFLLLSSRAVLAAADDSLATLRPAHPRLMVLDDQLPAIKALLQTNPQAADTFAQLKKQSDRMLTKPPARHVLIGPRMLAQSRDALHVISTTAGMYRLTGDIRYAERAKQEMLAVAAFPDWNPSHFLDVAEMTNACGIGYDWIYGQLSPDDRKIIEQAIIDKAFKPALNAYAKKEFWTKSNMNWSQVCAGGLTVGALAIADKNPDMARQIIQLCRETITKPMQEFAPDGGWDEGPGYWNYATSYNVFYLSATESALGTDFDFEKLPGFAQTGSFHIQLTSPEKKLFNFADAGDGYEIAPQMFWLATRFNRPFDAAWERANSAGEMNIFHLLWFNPSGQLSAEDEPLDALFKRVNVGVFRGNWTDPKAWYVAFKGGDNGANHAHLDLGSFVLDALGQRWATDLGPDDYNLPGYFSQQRFTYFRLSTRAHNTITFGGANQKLKATAQITSFVSQPDRAAAVIDLSEAYPTAKSVHRGICMLNRKRVLLQDEIETDSPKPLEWNFHTPAKVEVSGNKATLSLKGVRLRATLLSPADAKFETTDCDVPPPQKPNPGITDLVVHCSGTVKVAVLFSAIDDIDAAPTQQDLADWPRK